MTNDISSGTGASIRQWHHEVTPTPTPTPVATPTPNAAQTIVSLSFDNNLLGADGAAPVQSSGVTFESGIKGQGALVDGTDVLSYATAGHFNPVRGTLEFWLKPRWSGADAPNGRTLFSVGNSRYTANNMILEKDGANNLAFIFGPADSEGGKVHAVGGWAANEWHHIAVTWTIPGIMKTYVDGVERVSHAATSQDLITSLPSTFSIGSIGGGTQANAVIDELRISDIARTPEEIVQSYIANLTVNSLLIRPTVTEMYQTWQQTPQISVSTNVGQLSPPASAAAWASSNPAIATVDGAGLITAVSAGTVNITATLNGFQATTTINVKAPVRAPVMRAIDPYLSTPAADSLYEIPVVAVVFLPTNDGTTIDTSYDPAFHALDPKPLAEFEANLDDELIKTKFSAEEGSRFRGYANSSARPSLGYRVIAYHVLYEPSPPGKTIIRAGHQLYQPDYQQILSRLDMQNYVNNLGVKEVWMFIGGVTPLFASYDPSIHTPAKLREIPESNMSSPITGDVSNSDRFNDDLPVYSKTYVVYGGSIRSTGGGGGHLRGHQYESIFSYLAQRQDGSTDLFWKKFVGYETPGNFLPGRCGWTHTPPNTTGNYDYRTNYNLVESDCQDWRPDHTGQRAPVNALTWGNVPYPWPYGRVPATQEDRNELHWYIWWMQNYPGLGNAIPHGPNRMTNWWSFVGDWDTSINANLGLYGPAATPTPTPMPTATPTPTPVPSPNPLGGSEFFVRQHYLDFLNREADSSGLQFWVQNIESCGGNQQCREVKRVETSAAFFLSIEFQNTGYLVHRFHTVSFPNSLPRHEQFQSDLAKAGAGVVVNAQGWEQLLEANKQGLALEWVQRAEFLTRYPQGTPAADYVNSLFQNAGVTPTQAERDAAVAAFGGGGIEGRARALRSVADSGSVYNKQYNSAFVLMQYFGYLRRNPNDPPDADLSGYNFWLSKLDSFSALGEDVRNEAVALRRVRRAEMINAFLASSEYRRRFGQP